MTATAEKIRQADNGVDVDAILEASRNTRGAA